jgi:HPt (histidine-containing phosphotransfer) domain-containing protein
MNDQDLAKTIARLFMDDIPGKINSLRKAVETNDLQNVIGHAHTIKGSAANVAGKTLSMTAANMEKAGQSSNLTEIKALLPEIEKQFELLKIEMKAMLE